MLTFVAQLQSWAKMHWAGQYPRTAPAYARVAVVLFAGALALGAAPAQAQPEEPYLVPLVSLRVRSGPGVSYPTTGALVKGVGVEVVSTSPCGWFETTAGGWSSGGATYSTLVGDTSSIPSSDLACVNPVAAPAAPDTTTCSTCCSGCSAPAPAGVCQESEILAFSPRIRDGIFDGEDITSGAFAGLIFDGQHVDYAGLDDDGAGGTDGELETRIQLFGLHVREYFWRQGTWYRVNPCTCSLVDLAIRIGGEKSARNPHLTVTVYGPSGEVLAHFPAK